MGLVIVSLRWLSLLISCVWDSRMLHLIFGAFVDRVWLRSLVGYQLASRSSGATKASNSCSSICTIASCLISRILSAAVRSWSSCTAATWLAARQIAANFAADQSAIDFTAWDSTWCSATTSFTVWNNSSHDLQVIDLMTLILNDLLKSNLAIMLCAFQLPLTLWYFKTYLHGQSVIRILLKWASNDILIFPRWVAILHQCLLTHIINQKDIERVIVALICYHLHLELRFMEL